MAYIVVSLILIVIVIYVLLNSSYKNTNYYKNQFIDSYKFKNINNVRFDIVNLGSNQPKFGFDYNLKSKINGMNWALGSQSFEYDYKILKEFHEHLNDAAHVLIPICPFSFFFSKYQSDELNYKYYPILHSNLINNYSPITKFLYINHPIISAKRNLYKLIKDVAADSRLELSSNPMTTVEIERDAQNWINDWKVQFTLNNLNQIELSEENLNSINKNIAILNKIISFCVERNYKPVLVVLPLTRELNQHLPETFVKKFIFEPIDKANVIKVPVLNYMKHSYFQSSELYINSFFLNKNGRQEFTSLVVNDISQLVKND